MEECMQIYVTYHMENLAPEYQKQIKKLKKRRREHRSARGYRTALSCLGILRSTLEGWKAVCGYLRCVGSHCVT